MIVLTHAPDSIKLAQSASLPEAIMDWEDKVDEVAGFQRISPHRLASFAKQLCVENDTDSYLTSPVYYAFTGRKGLWVYREGDAFIPFCWHPNVHGQILVFPPRGDLTVNVLSNLLKQMPAPPMGLRVARIKHGADFVETFAAQPACSLELQLVTEDMLDWRYPLHVLSTEKVMKMDGPDFRHIRNHVRYASKHGVTVEYPETELKPYLEQFVDCWVSNRAKTSQEAIDLASPHTELLDMWAKQSLPIEGLVCRIDGVIQAFTLWDVSNSKTPTANRFINLCNPSVHGLADFVTQRTAEYLFSKGILYLNIGGSETASLDYFKSKFMPAYSIQLGSIDVKKSDVQPVQVMTAPTDRSRFTVANSNHG